MQQLLAYIRYYLRAITIRSVQNPYVLDLIKETLEDDRMYYAFDEIEALREAFEENQNEITVEDFGAGSRKNLGSQRKISTIAQTSTSPPHKLEFLFKLTKYLQPNQILEFGTCLGLSALSMHKAHKKGQLTTIEGSSNIASIAKHLFDSQEANIDLIQDKFDDYLISSAFENLKNIDLFYLDGNHAYEPTLDYIKAVYPKMSPYSIVILDDIYWSHEMQRAWQELSMDERFDISLDVFDFGLLIRQPENHGQENLTLIESRKKPFG